MELVDSKYIIKIHEFIKQSNYYNIILELSNGCSLIDLLNEREEALPFREAEVNLIIRQVVQGCYALYEKNIIHRDLNIKNVLIHFP